MSTPKLGKKWQEFDYKVDMLANKLDDYQYADFDDYYDEGVDQEPYNIEEYDYLKFKKQCSDFEEKKELSKNELEDTGASISAQDLPRILYKSPPQFKINNEKEFYSKARAICENSFYLETEEKIVYFQRFLKEFDQVQNRSVFVKRLLQVLIEKHKDTEIGEICQVLKTLFLHGFLTKQQIRRGLDRIYIDGENLKEDAPDYEGVIGSIITQLVKDDVLAPQVLIKIPPEIRENMSKNPDFSKHFSKYLDIFERESEIKSKFEEVVDTYLENYDAEDVIERITTTLALSDASESVSPSHRPTNFGEIGIPWFIRKAILISSGKGNKEREKVSQLMKILSHRLKITYAQFSYCFDHLIQNIEDYTLDIPFLPEYVSMFIARAIFDGYFSPQYILNGEVYDSEVSEQLLVLKSAVSYLSLWPQEEYLANIWGSAFTNEQLSKKFQEILDNFYYNGTSEAELVQILKDLDCNFYMHEFVRKLVIFFVSLDPEEEVDYPKIIRGINTLLNNDILSKSQLEVGVKKAKHEVSVVLKYNTKANANLAKLQEECLSKIRFKFE